MNDATLVSGGWTTGDLLHYNAVHGFYAAVAGVKPFVPARIDGSGIAANGLALTNEGGYVSNGACDLVQTDADKTVFGRATIYGDQSTWSDLGIANWNAHVNGTNNVWVQWEKAGANNTCHVKKVIAYDDGVVLTLAQYNQLVRWAGDPTCGDGMVDFLGSAVTFNGVAVVHNGVDVVYNEV